MATLPPPLVQPYPLPDSSVEQLRDTGHLLLRGVLSPEEVAAYRPALREYVLGKRRQMSPADQAMGASPDNTFFSLTDAPQAIVNFVTAPRLGGLAARLLGVKAVRLLHFCGFFKAGGGPPTPWHQDLNFIPLDSAQALSVWIPLMDVTPEMGGLLFAEGSHQRGAQPPSAASRFRIAANGAMRAGDISLHMGWTLHASLKNSSSLMREAIAVCYYADGARVGGNGTAPFMQSLRAAYFPGLQPGDPAVGPLNPVVSPRREPMSTSATAGDLPALDGRYDLSPEALAAFHQRGHVKLNGVLRPGELAAYRPHLNRVVQEHYKQEHAMERKVAGAGKNWNFVNNLWTLAEAARRLIHSQRLARIAAELMGVEGVRLFRDQSYFKGPGGANTPWHQDSRFMPLDTDNILTLWVPLTRITPDMAPMGYVTGSHQAGYLGTSNGDDESMDRFEEDLRAKGFQVDNYGSFEAGDIAAHWARTLHSSRTNVSPLLREVLVIVYFEDGARVAPERPLAKDAHPSEFYANIIQRENRTTSLPGLRPGDLAAGPMTPLLYSRAWGEHPRAAGQGA